jgi:hypothetical protein
MAERYPGGIGPERLAPTAAYVSGASMSCPGSVALRSPMRTVSPGARARTG